MSSNSPSTPDEPFLFLGSPTAVEPGQGSNFTVKKALTRDECRLAKMALEARNANHDLTARIKMDSAFMLFKDSEINVLRARVENLEYENKQLKRVIEALEPGRKNEEGAKKRSGRDSREDMAFLSKYVEEVDNLGEASDASESLLSERPSDPEAAKTFVPRDLGPMLGLSIGLDIQDQSENWVAKRLQTRATAESVKHGTTGGGHLPRNETGSPKGQDIGTAKAGATRAPGADGLAPPNFSSNEQMISRLTGTPGNPSGHPTEVIKDKQALEKQMQEISPNSPKEQARQTGAAGNYIPVFSRKAASPKSPQNSILEQRQFELCKSFLKDAKKSQTQPSIPERSPLDSPQLSSQAPAVSETIWLGTQENQGGANSPKSEIGITISPSEEVPLPYNYEHIREVVIQNLPTDINYNRLFSCIHGGVVEAVIINMSTLEARIIFMEPESARRFYKVLELEGIWVARESGGSGPRGKDETVRCGLGKFLWTARSAIPSPAMIADVWEHKKTRCLEVRNVSGMTVEAIANHIMGYMKPGPTRGDVIESIVARNSGITGQYIVVIRFTAISYAISVQKKMALDIRYMGCVCVFLPDTCGNLIGSRPPDIWFNEPKSLKARNEASVERGDEGLGPELEVLGHLTPKPGLMNWCKHLNPQDFLGQPYRDPKPQDPRVERQNVSYIRDVGRSVLITNLPRDIDYNTLFGKIRGGRVEHLQIFEPVTSTDSFSALILFVTQTGAQTYRDFIREWHLMVGERRITRKDHIPSGLFNNMNILAASTSETGVTRCICIYNLREKIAEEDIKADLRRAETTENLAQWDNVNVERSGGEDGVSNISLRFTSIAGALWARRALQKLERYVGCIFRHARDPCANGVDELVEARDPAAKQT